MAHGHEDYLEAAQASTIYTLQDMGELAARLKSIDLFDRRGNVIFLEDFQGSLAKGWTSVGGGGATVTISNESSRFGDFSCKLSTGNIVNSWAQYGLMLAYPVLSKIGFETSFYVVDVSDVSGIDFFLYLYDGTTAWYTEVYWDATNDTWYYQNSTGAYTALSPTAKIFEGSNHYNFLKLVVDFVNNKYVRLIHNSRTYDLADLPLYSAASATSPRLVVSVKNVTAVADNCLVYLGHMIVTQNE